MSTMMIMAGGTGGHVFPALAVAHCLRDHGVNVVWLGTRRGLEARAVPAQGIDVEWISIRGLRGRGLVGWLLAPARLALAGAQALAAILRRRPDALLGMGGFVAGPGGLVACLLRRPLLIHEQNAVAGMTNRWLARCASRVLTGFPAPAGLAASGQVYTGNPVRADIAALPVPEARLAGRQGPVRVLVIGGSQGAQVFNETLPPALATLDAAQRPQVRHQCGAAHEAATRAAYARAGMPDARVDPFIEDMAGALAWADLVLCRAGAMTLAELCAAGVASLLVPYAHAVNDHQSANARFLVEAGAAAMLAQAQCDASRLAGVLADLCADRARLLDMAQRARALARPQAAETVARHCLELMRA